MSFFCFVCRRLPAAVLLIAVILAPASAVAQTVDPTTAEFDPSADHNAIADGAAVVDRYDMEFYLQGAAQPFQVQALGKPAPEADGKIRVNFASLMGAALPTPGIIYESSVAAVGPGGAGRSVRSNTFMFSVPCSYSVSPTTLTSASSGGTVNVSVTAAAGCAWTASEGLSWVSITSGASGSGNGTVSLSVSANTTGSSRSDTITVAGQSVSLTLTGGCAYTVSPTSISMFSAGGTGTISVTAASGCTWTAVDDSSWIVLTTGTAGNGNGTVTYTVGVNPLSSSRTGNITVAGQTVPLVQSPPSGPPTPPNNLRVVTPTP